MHFDDGQDEPREMIVIQPTPRKRVPNQLPPKTRFLMSESQQTAMTAYKRNLEKQPRIDQRARYDESTIQQLSGGINSRGICRVSLRGIGGDVVVKGIPDNDFRSVYEPFILQVGLGPHPHVVRLRNVFYASSRGEIVLEFESCTRSLLDFIIERDMTPHEVRAAAIQLMAGVRYLTEKNVIHCDLKPENLFLAAPGGGSSLILKIGDFGVACILPTAAHQPPPTFNVNPTGHKPPEILLMLPWSFGVDVFSVGCTLATICGVRNHPLLFRDDCSIQQHLDHVLSGFGAAASPSYALLPPHMTYDRDMHSYGSVHQYVTFAPPRGAFFTGRTRDPFLYVRNLMHDLTHDDSFYTLIQRMLEPDPAKRISIAAASLWVGTPLQ
jgi:serine/threonine protein kinase